MEFKRKMRLESHFNILNKASNFRIARPHESYFEKLRVVPNEDDNNYTHISEFERIALEGAIHTFEKFTSHKVCDESIEYTYSTSLLGTNTGEPNWRDRRYYNLFRPVIVISCETDKGEAVICVSIPDYTEVDKAKGSRRTTGDYVHIYYSVFNFGKHGGRHTNFHLKGISSIIKAIDKHGYRLFEKQSDDLEKSM